MGKIKDRTDQRYGKLTAQKLLNVKRGQSYWQCICDCGNTKVTTGHALHEFGRGRGGGVGSCGCLHAESAAKRRLEDKEAGFKKVWTQYRTVAKTSSREFTLTENEFRELLAQHCFYCETEPKSIAHPSKRKANKEPFLYNGIDRVNNQIGYTLENCVTCCKYCNKSKNNRTLKEFLEWIKDVYKTSCIISSK